MKNAHSIYILNSLKAKESLVASKLIPTNRKPSVQKWLNTASDEDIEALALDSGFNADTIITSDDIVLADMPTPSVTKTTDSKGNAIAINTVNLSLNKFNRVKVYNKEGFTGQFKMAYYFNYGEKSVKTQSKLLDKLLLANELHIEDEFLFKLDSIKITRVPAVGDNKGYSFYEGAVLEKDTEILEDAREGINKRENAIALMSKTAQEKINESTAELEIAKFHEMFPV